MVQHSDRTGPERLLVDHAAVAPAGPGGAPPRQSRLKPTPALVLPLAWRVMRLVGRFGLVCSRLAAAGFLVTGAAACAGVAAAPAAVPHSSVPAVSTAPAGVSLDGQPAFVTAGTAVDHPSHAAGSSRTPTASGGGATSGGSALRAGNPDGHAAVPAAGLAVDTSHPQHVIGDGSPAGCTSAA